MASPDCVVGFNRLYFKVGAIRAIVTKGFARKVCNFPRLFFRVPIAKGVPSDMIGPAFSAIIIDFHGFPFS